MFPAFFFATLMLPCDTTSHEQPIFKTNKEKTLTGKQSKNNQKMKNATMSPEEIVAKIVGEQIGKLGKG